MVSYFVKYTRRVMTLLTLVLFTSVLLEMKERSPLYWSLVSAISYLSARGRACMWPFISLTSSLPGALLSSDLMEVLFIFQTLEEFASYGVRDNGGIATLSNYIELCEQHEVDPPKWFLVSVNCVWVSRLHVLGHQVLYNG